MLDHLSIAVSDLARAGAWYDAVLGALGFARVLSAADRIGYGERNGPDDGGRTYISIVTGTPGGSGHVAFAAPSRSSVDAFHAAAADRSDGAPGVRPEYHDAYYAAFVRDPDGNRLEAVCHLRAV